MENEMINGILKAAFACGVALAAITSSTPGMANGEPTRVKIAAPGLRENGCSETTQTYKIAIPNPDRLDLSYQGVLGGIKAVENHANIGHWFGNFQLVDNGTALVFQMRAKGAGNRLNSPFSGGNVCLDGAGATEVVDIRPLQKLIKTIDKTGTRPPKAGAFFVLAVP